MAKVCGIKERDVRCADTKGQHYSEWGTRQGKFIAVRDLTVAGKTRGEMMAFVKHIQAQGAEVVEIETGAVAGTGAAMLDRALAIVHAQQRGMTAKRAADMARAAKVKRREGRMNEEDARLVWGDLSKSDDECVARTGWPRSTALSTIAKGGRKALALAIAAESKAARSRKRK